MEEVQRLSGKPIARTSSGSSLSGGAAGPGSPDGAGGFYLTAEQLVAGGGGGGVRSAGDVISQRLVTYRSLDELVEQNRCGTGGAGEL